MLSFPYSARKTPALIAKIGAYPLAYGTLALVRSLGRLGVDVHALAEDRFVPYGVSRYLRRLHVVDTAPDMPDEARLAQLAAVVHKIGQRPVLYITDDEAAAFAARNRKALEAFCLLAPVPEDLPFQLASKAHLLELCSRHGCPTPKTFFARTRVEALTYARTADYPLVLKNSEPFLRLTSPAVRATTIVQNFDAFEAIATTWPEEPNVLIQDYIDTAFAEDWIVDAYVARDGAAPAAFSGLKTRSWPPEAGFATVAAAIANREVIDLSLAFCRAIGYRGVLDMDWRRDTRTGAYKLLDFNPRVGAAFGLFMNTAEVDVVRAQHLDLTGHAVPPGPQLENRDLHVEHLEIAGRLRGGKARHLNRQTPAQKIYAWWAFDDPLPALVAGVRFALQFLGSLFGPKKS